MGIQNKYAVLIPLFNGLNHTQHALMSLYQAIGVDDNLVRCIEVVVIDDGSTDGSKEWINNNYPQTHVLQGDGNLWWSGAINMGAKYALNSLKSDYVVLWNNDITPDINYFTNLIEVAENVKDQFIIASKIFLLHEPSRIWQMGCNYNNISGKHQVIASGQQDSQLHNVVIKADWASGMGTIIHRNIINSVGYWDDKNFPQYHGDSDFCLRAKSAGIDLYVYPQLKIWNDRSSSGYNYCASIQNFFLGLTKLNSLYNISKQLKFAKIHSKSILAYTNLVSMYVRYVGKYVKYLVGVK